MSLIKNIQRSARSIERLSRKMDMKEEFNVLNKEWELEEYEKRLRNEYETGLITENEFNRLLEEKEAELMSARCIKCGEQILGEDDSFCGKCAN